MHSLPSLGVLDRLAIALDRRNRLAMIVGMCLGGFVPVSTYVLARFETPDAVWKWGIVGAGLCYSALTVFDWARVAFDHQVKALGLIKALGFVILLESVMTISATPWLGQIALSFLVLVNAIGTAYNLVNNRVRAPRSKRKAHHLQTNAGSKTGTGRRLTVVRARKTPALKAS